MLIELEAIAPVTAVYGNVDPPEIRSRLPQVATLELDGFEIVVTHGDQFGHPTPEKLHAAFPRAEIIVYGHTHKPLLELVDKTVTVMNPGGAGRPRFDLKPSVGIMELEPGIPPRARIVDLRRGWGGALARQAIYWLGECFCLGPFFWPPLRVPHGRACVDRP